jgi:ParB family chromosome partitioning protein
VVLLSDIVKNPFQTRILNDEEEDSILRNSMRTGGMLVKPLLRPHPSIPDKFQVIDGQRRVTAARALGWTDIVVDIVEFSDKKAAEATLIANLQRKGLNPVEEAQSYKLMIVEFGYTEKMVADRYGKSRPYIANRLRLLKMPLFLKLGVLCKTLSSWQALMIMALPEGYRHWMLGSLAMDWFLTPTELKSIVKSIRGGEIFISWPRVVPVAGLELGEEREQAIGELVGLPTRLNSGFQVEQVACYPDGHVILGHDEVRRARAEGVKRLAVDVFFETEWLLESRLPVAVWRDTTDADESKPRILPRLNTEQGKNMGVFLSMLKGREEDYPVLMVTHLSAKDVFDLPEAVPVEGGGWGGPTGKADFIGWLPSGFRVRKDDEEDTASHSGSERHK